MTFMTATVENGQIVMRIPAEILDKLLAGEVLGCDSLTDEYGQRKFCIPNLDALTNRVVSKLNVEDLGMFQGEVLNVVENVLFDVSWDNDSLLLRTEDSEDDDDDDDDDEEEDDVIDDDDAINSHNRREDDNQAEQEWDDLGHPYGTGPQ
jgi:hypothetical protein